MEGHLKEMFRYVARSSRLQRAHREYGINPTGKALARQMVYNSSQSVFTHLGDVACKLLTKPTRKPSGLIHVENVIQIGCWAAE